MQNVIDSMNEIIARSGLKKKDVAKGMSMTDKKLSDVLHGRRTITVEIIRAFCKTMSVTPNELFMQKKE